ncbi:MAG TPA: RecX family transcriptional regulator, partial [Acidobacteriota bacterium]|nr:RecX family transcriptional regulator [Acidobacteriota bacterium]
LNDQEVGYRRARYLRTRKLYGNRRIFHELQSLGLDAKMIGLILEQVEKEAPESASLQEAVRARVATRNLPENRIDLKKLFDYAIRLGYPPAAVREVLEPYFASLNRDED